MGVFYVEVCMKKGQYLTDKELEWMTNYIVHKIWFLHHCVFSSACNEAEKSRYEFSIVKVSNWTNTDVKRIKNSVHEICSRLIKVKVQSETNNSSEFDYALLFSRVKYTKERFVVSLNVEALACSDIITS
ncbi:hypothetical protein C1141_08745 [Vibrio agarivorans]|nr:hypothetical protein C1141_08745 [Vibrio agarivorans]